MLGNAVSFTKEPHATAASMRVSLAARQQLYGVCQSLTACCHACCNAYDCSEHNNCQVLAVVLCCCDADALSTHNHQLNLLLVQLAPAHITRVDISGVARRRCCCRAASSAPNITAG